MAVTLTVMTFVMITAGSMVTTMDAGDSVPDWPLSYGELLPPMVGNVFYEHGHRMIGWALGLLTIALTVVLFLKDSRRWVKNLGVLALVGVCFQGALGGLRVLAISNPEIQEFMLNLTGGGEDVEPMRVMLAMIHAATAQALFALMVLLSVVTSVGWFERPEAKTQEQARRLKRLAWITLILVYLQLAIGSYVRQTGVVLGLVIHMGGAFLVILHVTILAFRLVALEKSQTQLRRPGMFLLTLTLVQLFLGLGAWMATFIVEPTLTPASWQILFRSSHMVMGSLVFGTGVLLVLRLHRSLLSPQPDVSLSSDAIAEGAGS